MKYYWVLHKHRKYFDSSIRTTTFELSHGYSKNRIEVRNITSYNKLVHSLKYHKCDHVINKVLIMYSKTVKPTSTKIIN